MGGYVEDQTKTKKGVRAPKVSKLHPRDTGPLPADLRRSRREKGHRSCDNRRGEPETRAVAGRRQLQVLASSACMVEVLASSPLG